MKFHSIDPVFLRIGPLEFRWYGLMYILGFLSAYFIIRTQAKKRDLEISAELASDLVFTIALGIVLGGRLGYILFYDLSWYLAHPLKVLAVWEGGMSFHGGLLGALASSLYIFRKKNLDFWRMADTLSQAGPIGLGLGRLGNFINGELYGRVTDGPWGIVFPNSDGMPRHPSQLYEAFLEGVVLFTVVRLVARLKTPDGTVFWTFIGGYGLFRFCVEFFREPDRQLGFLLGGATMGQLLSLPMFFLGGIMIVAGFARRGKEGK
ncbi:MAG TPA: prolipoprotein diacylglyceryl transferase [Geobacteraceae bacterium]|nr:prolipoprotein diacylglyceryl transferase [Geobacteraceae bacterium]